MWRYSGASDPDRALLEEILDDEVSSRLDRVLQLKPKEKVKGKPIPLNASVVSKLEESQEVVVTSVEHRNPTAMSASDEQEAKRRVVVPMLRKHEASVDTIDEREAKQTQSPRPLVASPVSSPPVVDVAEQAKWSKDGRAMTGLSIAPTPMRKVWRPTLQRITASGGWNRVVAVNPSLPRVVPPRSVAGTVVAAVVALAAIPVLMTEVASEVTLVAPPPLAKAEEERETEPPALPGGRLHGSPSRSELKALGGDTTRMESERPAMARATEVVEIPSDNKADDMVELPVSSRELAVVQSEVGPSGGLPEGDLEWPCPEDLAKVRAAEVTVLWAEEQRAVERATTTERGLEAAKAHQAETEVGLRKSLADTEAALQKSLEALESEQGALVSEQNALESAQKALESEQKARPEVDQEVLMLRGRVMGTKEACARLREQVARQAEEFSTLENFHLELGRKVKSLEWDLETVKVTFGQNAEKLAKSHEERCALEGELDQIRNVAQLVILEVFESAPSTSAPTV
ncbi:uncharacterized protein [Miscanthus floridulus]|uniref:uncharacterized protein n=1 Tax=Miscanthus floridulus TaxID=154761 RepID=UPI0034579790